MAASPAGAVAAATAQQKNLEHEEMAWLFSISSLSAAERKTSQSRGAAFDSMLKAIDRCAASIKDADTHVYQRGVAVMALGRMLRREIGENANTGGVASMETLHKVQQAESRSAKRIITGVRLLRSIGSYFCSSIVRRLFFSGGCPCAGVRSGT